MEQGEFDWTIQGHSLPTMETPTKEETDALIPPAKDSSLDRAREFVSKARLASPGCRCPCCGKFVKTYKRPLNRTMAAALQWLVWASKEGLTWVDVPKTAPKWLLKSNQHTTLRWWGLIEKQEHFDSKKKSSGVWRPTARGVRFVRGEIRIPLAVFTEEGVPVGYSREEIDIRSHLGNFDYSEVMTAPAFPEIQVAHKG